MFSNSMIINNCKDFFSYPLRVMQKLWAKSGDHWDISKQGVFILLLRLLLNSWTCRGECQEGKKGQELLCLNTQIMEGKFAFLDFVMELRFFGKLTSLKI